MFKMRIMKNLIRTAVITTLLTALATPAFAYAADVPAIPDPNAAPVVIDPVDAFLAQSAFVGNSVGEGLTMYNNAKKKVPLGNATMLTRVSYSFYADEKAMTKYLPVFGGKAMRAKDAIKACGASYVFISMGTNDLVGKSTAEGAYAKYQAYLAGIMAENPFVTIFIESCTPTRPGSNVSNEKVTAFNAYMRAYCDMFPNMFYVDIATPLMDSTGHLSAALSSDGSVHLTMKAYEIWANTVRFYIANFLSARLEAMRQQAKINIEITRANYEEAMRKMEDKKLQVRKQRLLAEERQRQAEEERRRDELLNVPDEITIMQRVLAQRPEPSYKIISSIRGGLISFR